MQVEYVNICEKCAEKVIGALFILYVTDNMKKVLDNR